MRGKHNNVKIVLQKEISKKNSQTVEEISLLKNKHCTYQALKNVKCCRW